MGSSFFKGKGGHGPAITGGGNPGLEARAMGAAVSGGRGSAIGAQKSLGAASAINKAAFAPKIQKRGAAYPAGPKL
jgi:hypothetical protein